MFRPERPGAYLQQIPPSGPLRYAAVPMRSRLERVAVPVILSCRSSFGNGKCHTSMLGRLLAGSGRFGDVTGLDVTLPGSGIPSGATSMCSQEVASSSRGRGTDYTFAGSITGSSPAALPGEGSSLSMEIYLLVRPNSPYGSGVAPVAEMILTISSSPDS